MRNGASVNGLFGGRGVFDCPGSMGFVGALLGAVSSGGAIMLSFFPNSTAATRTIVRLGTRSNKGHGFVVIRLPRRASMGSRTCGTKCGGVYRVNGRQVHHTNGGVGSAGRRVVVARGVSPVKRSRVPLNSANIVFGGAVFSRCGNRAGLSVGGLRPRGLSANFHMLGYSASGVGSMCCGPTSCRLSLFSALTSGVGRSHAPRSLLFRMVLSLNMLLSDGVRRDAVMNGGMFGITSNFLCTYFSRGMARSIVARVTGGGPCCFMVESDSVTGSDITAGFRRVFTACDPGAMEGILW